MTKCEAAVLAHLQAASVPLTAYQILAGLRPKRPRISPPTIYRALAALETRGLAQRIPTLHAWVHAPAATDADALLVICDHCRKVAIIAAPEMITAVARAATVDGFRPDRPVIEVHGRCGACARGAT